MDTDCKASFVPATATGYFSNLIQDYLNGDEKLRPFYEFEVSDEGLAAAIEARKNFPVDRALLSSVIAEQYEHLNLSEKVERNIRSLSSANTFTVTSAHQPNLMTGYLYFVYKIIHSAKLAAHLGSLHPGYDFVPVFYIGSEDNDFEELGHFRYGDKSFEWRTDQKGAVGMMKVDKALEQLLKELFPLLGPLGTTEKNLKAIIKKAYATGNTIAMATRILINELLGHLGVLVIDANDARLKKRFAKVIEQEILNPKAYELVSDVSERLQQHYKVQAFYRPVNFFYLKEGLRERIEREGDEYVVLNTDIRYSAPEMEQEIDRHPERFSPNVILRGLYQETILPNVAFIGGGSEVAYWMQLRSVFDHYNVFYPVIILRQSALILDQKTIENLQRTGLDDTKMFQRTKTLVDGIVAREKADHWSLDSYKAKLQQWEHEWQERYKQLDKNLTGSLLAVSKKMQHQLQVLDKKVDRALKAMLDIEVQRIYSFKEHAFPNDGLQERYETFLPYYLDHGPGLFKDLYQYTDPFGREFLILRYFK